MSDDAKERLEAEAERLRQERERASLEVANDTRDAEARAKADAATFSERRLLRSVTRFTMPLVFCTLAGAFISWSISLDNELKHPPTWTG